VLRSGDLKGLRVALIVTSAVVMSAATSATVGAATGPGAPTALRQINLHGNTMKAGTWMVHGQFTASMTAVGNGGWLHAEIEVVPFGTAFTGTATERGKAQKLTSGSAGTMTVSVSNLADGAYAWQARIVDAKGDASAWLPFATTGPAVRVDGTAPAAPHIASSTDKRGQWTRANNEQFSWSAHDAGSGIAGYSYRLTSTASATHKLAGGTTAATYTGTADGHWYFHVWAKDAAGNWSSPAVFPFIVYRSAPRVDFGRPETRHFNPYKNRDAWPFHLSRRANVKIALLRSHDKYTVRTFNLGSVGSGKHSFQWHARNKHNRIMPRGWYWIRIHTSDALGNSKTFSSPGVWLTPRKPRYPYVREPGRHIVISLSKEALYAYNGQKLKLQTLVTTGNPALRTPTGHFGIFAKYSPFEFISPWPEGSPYYYAPSWVHYAMEFDSGGYFIHDAPWRTVYGPGSDGPGQPGTNYGGTHGCVNVPLKAERWLYHWAGIGTVVDIIN
jgi:hypothetical protein